MMKIMTIIKYDMLYLFYEEYTRMSTKNDGLLVQIRLYPSLFHPAYTAKRKE